MSKNFHSRSSYRLTYHNYAEANAYSITICAYRRRLLYGKIVDAKVILSTIGEIIDEEIRRIAVMRQGVEVDTYVVMPNHVHMILLLHGNGSDTVPRAFRAPASGTVSSIINGMKARCTSRVRKGLGQLDAIIWQPRFHDRLIRDEDELNRTRIYILNNPAVWEEDPENPERRARTVAVQA